MTLNDDIREYLELYRNQEPQQARVFVSRWLKDAWDAASPDAQARITADLEFIAGQHGLRTPVIIEVVG